MVKKGKKRETTSIKIDPELWKKVKIEAIKRDMKVYELVELALKHELGIKDEENEFSLL